MTDYTTSTLSDYEYRTLPRICNSDLSELDGVVMRAKPETLYFGSAFHNTILEPEKEFDLSPISLENLYHLQRMQDSVRNDAQLTQVITNAQREQVRLWVDPLTGLLLKAKLDAAAKPKHLLDLKTTSCKSKAEFVESIYKYSYDRQAVFYLSSDPTKARYFEFVGVQKMAPYGLFRVSFHSSDKLLIAAREKMNRLLQKAAKELASPTGWRPSAWSRKPENV